MILVHYFAEVPHPLGEVETALHARGADLGAWAAMAYRHGEEMRARVGVRGPFAKTVTLDVGEPSRSSTAVTFPVRWEATGPSSLFPEMDAEISLAPLGRDATHLTFIGRYSPPVDGFGAAVDRVVLHHVAESTVKQFVDRLVAGIEELVPRRDVEGAGARSPDQ